MTYSAHMFTVLLTMAHILMDSKQKRVSYYGGSNDDMEHAVKRGSVEPSARTHSASTTFLPTSTPASRQQSRPKGYNSDGDLCKHFPEAEFSNKKHTSRPNSIENSENASTSSSLLNLKGSFDHIHRRSESLSSEETVLNKDVANSCRDGHFSPSSAAAAAAASNTKHRSGMFSSDGPQKNVHTPSVRHRTASPGSEMVTLEEFLEESNWISPLNHTPSRDDLLSDYFRKVNEPPSIGSHLSQAQRKETPKMPTSYVTPTVKVPIANEDAPKPGHYVKPSPRTAESELLANMTSPHKLAHASPSQPSKGSRQMAHPSQHSAMSRQSTSLNRTFSLASADLLKATGPETYRRYDSLPKSVTSDIRTGKELNSQTLPLPSPAGSQVPLRERPQSAKTGGSLQGVDARCRQLDVRRLSLAPPKEERPLSFPPFSCSPATNDDLNCQPLEQASTASEQHRLSPHATSKTKPKSTTRSGEVATVTPVRIVPSNAEGKVSPALSPSDASVTKCQSRSPENKTLSGSPEEANRGVVSKNPPSSPDPHSDQQTVWYEYGCV